METLFGGRTEAIGIVDVANSMSDLQRKDGDFCVTLHERRKRVLDNTLIFLCHSHPIAMMIS